MGPVYQWFLIELQMPATHGVLRVPTLPSTRFCERCSPFCDHQREAFHKYRTERPSHSIPLSLSHTHFPPSYRRTTHPRHHSEQVVVRVHRSFRMSLSCAPLLLHQINSQIGWMIVNLGIAREPRPLGRNRHRFKSAGEPLFLPAHLQNRR